MLSGSKFDVGFNCGRCGVVVGDVFTRDKVSGDGVMHERQGDISCAAEMVDRAAGLETGVRDASTSSQTDLSLPLKRAARRPAAKRCNEPPSSRIR